MNTISIKQALNIPRLSASRPEPRERGAKGSHAHMPHKRSFETRQRRAARKIILEAAYRDRFRAETVNRLSVSDIINRVVKAFGGKVHLGTIPKVEEGESSSTLRPLEASKGGA